MNESSALVKTAEEIEHLKSNWFADPCWDIEETEGFEAHRAELLEYHEKCKELWKAQAFGRNLRSKEPLTKRELIAAMCLQGLISNSKAQDDIAESVVSGRESADLPLAAFAVRQADRLLAELEKPTNEPIEVDR